MSDDPEISREDAELEALLRGLQPSRLDVHQSSELNRTRERIHLEHDRSPARMQWARVLPVMLACFVVMFGVALFRYGALLRHQSKTSVPLAMENAELATPAAAGTPSTAPVPRFLPVSAHGTIVKTSSGGVVETESGPRERLNVEYQDAYHWHDPESGTNIRIFQPRNEEIVVPFITD